jgi:hypothetical protein
MYIMRRMLVAVLITSVARLATRIREYHKQAEEMAVLMPYNRVWYALQTEKGWLLGPSKFVGYDDLNAKEYLKREKGSLDGRVTEGVLQRWAELVEEGHPKYDELHTALDEFCAAFGKKPNSLARISLVNTKDEEVTSGLMFSDDLVSLMVAVYRKLTPAQKSAFKKQVA